MNRPKPRIFFLLLLIPALTACDLTEVDVEAIMSAEMDWANAWTLQAGVLSSAGAMGTVLQIAISFSILLFAFHWAKSVWEGDVEWKKDFLLLGFILLIPFMGRIQEALFKMFAPTLTGFDVLAKGLEWMDGGGLASVGLAITVLLLASVISQVYQVYILIHWVLGVISSASSHEISPMYKPINMTIGWVIWPWLVFLSLDIAAKINFDSMLGNIAGGNTVVMSLVFVGLFGMLTYLSLVKIPDWAAPRTMKYIEKYIPNGKSDTAETLETVETVAKAAGVSYVIAEVIKELAKEGVITTNNNSTSNAGGNGSKGSSPNGKPPNGGTNSRNAATNEQMEVQALMNQGKFYAASKKLEKMAASDNDEQKSRGSQAEGNTSSTSSTSNAATVSHDKAYARSQALRGIEGSNSDDQENDMDATEVQVMPQQNLYAVTGKNSASRAIPETEPIQQPILITEEDLPSEANTRPVPQTMSKKDIEESHSSGETVKRLGSYAAGIALRVIASSI